MDLDQQIQVLIENAPQDGSTPGIMKAIAPGLKEFALKLRHLNYYVFRTLDEAWVLTTLGNRLEPTMEKKVIYAFPTPKDASSFQQMPDPQVISSSVPVTHILFQMFAMDMVDSTVFIETPGNLMTGTEIFRDNLADCIHAYMQKYLLETRGQSGSNIPPNFA